MEPRSVCVRGIQEVYKRVNEIEAKAKERVEVGKR